VTSSTEKVIVVMIAKLELRQKLLRDPSAVIPWKNSTSGFKIAMVIRRKSIGTQRPRAPMAAG
jgi:hypothetical protein